jgi:hypothetical protein
VGKVEIQLTFYPVCQKNTKLTGKERKKKKKKNLLKLDISIDLGHIPKATDPPYFSFCLLPAACSLQPCFMGVGLPVALSTFHKCPLHLNQRKLLDPPSSRWK